jgi:hypothetical protein
MSSELVRELQKAVEETVQSGAAADLSNKVKKAQDAVSQALRGHQAGTLSVQSEGTQQDMLRVTCPTKSTVTFTPPSHELPAWVEFYLTRPRADGVSETAPLGKAKYSDGDGSWKARFTTERFARAPNDPLVVHAEVFANDGRLAAVSAIAPIA